MSAQMLELLKNKLGNKVLETNAFRGDEEILVDSSDWVEVATLLKNDSEIGMDFFVDLTAVDYPERSPEEPRFDVVLLARSTQNQKRIKVKTKLEEGKKLPTLTSVWAGTNWAEREIWDMFGIAFEGHPDLRRILMYDEFEGYPLRKDYPIDRAQPLVPYRDTSGIEKLAPFGIEEGQPWGRIRWDERLAGEDQQVSPSISLQTGQREALSQSDEMLPNQPSAEEKKPSTDQKQNVSS